MEAAYIALGIPFLFLFPIPEWPCLVHAGLPSLSTDAFASIFCTTRFVYVVRGFRYGKTLIHARFKGTSGGCCLVNALRPYQSRNWRKGTQSHFIKPTLFAFRFFRIGDRWHFRSVRLPDALTDRSRCEELRKSSRKEVYPVSGYRLSLLVSMAPFSLQSNINESHPLRFDAPKRRSSSKGGATHEGKHQAIGPH
ncbi:hypothetical protein ZHAS_00011536 [Anopheles sinensis]|uniref:Uncharacterized protein n=1 Tax=Anopheles sinensis TaxID=74873 RepID=A0A084W054_ANOSI|nr:hypothetical protein ZHAS_00011536 [Anopheles sinensis]